MRHPRAPRTIRMDQLWLVIETLSIPGLFNFWSWTRINRIESRIESRTKSRIEVRFNIKEKISLTWCHVSLLALVWLIWCCVCSNRLCTARASHQKPILWKPAVYAVLENPKYWTTALNKRRTIWISPTLYGMLYSSAFVLATLLLQGGTGFQLLMLYVVACSIQMVLLTKMKSSRPIILINLISCLNEHGRLA